MIVTKTCSTCKHYPNDKHCIGCKWDGKRENTKWELKKNPIVIERAVLDKIRDEIAFPMNPSTNKDYECGWNDSTNRTLQIIDKYIDRK